MVSLLKIPNELKQFLLSDSSEILINDKILETNINNDIMYEDLNKVKELINILTKKESDDRDIWIKIGMCLKNILEDKVEVLDIWDEFSQLSKKI